MISLRQRLNRGLAVILITIFAIHWFAADWVIRTVAEKQMLTRLEHDSDSLLDTLKHSKNGDVDLDNSRVPLVYDQAYSGHYFVIQINDRTYTSTSLQNQPLALQPIANSQAKHYHLPGPQQQPLLALGRDLQKNGHAITLTVAEDLTDIGNDILHIRLAYLGLTLIILTLAILLQSLDVKRAMKPLRAVQIELGKIANGHQQQITTEVPVEIRPLVKEVNRLIILIERRLQQSRTAIGNLAHALKTPLAVLVRLTENPALQAHPQINVLLISQTQAIQDRIERELKRARLSGHIQSGAAFNPYQELTSLADLLSNIYTEKHLAINVEAPDYPIPFDREDLLEIIGNLADNACKWAKSTVAVSVIYQQNLIITVEDDGPGCPEHELQQLTQRGVRLDESVQGHGLGLAIVRDIAEFYGGRLELARSQHLGGLLVTVSF
ncbi:MAG TPA: sensor histidine kinase [Methylobacter sp.]|jgi:signal transduction histidine kinase